MVGKEPPPWQAQVEGSERGPGVDTPSKRSPKPICPCACFVLCALPPGEGTTAWWMPKLGELWGQRPGARCRRGCPPDLEDRVGTNPGAGSGDKTASALDPGLQGGRSGEANTNHSQALVHPGHVTHTTQPTAQPQEGEVSVLPLQRRNGAWRPEATCLKSYREDAVQAESEPWSV